MTSDPWFFSPGLAASVEQGVAPIAAATERVSGFLLRGTEAGDFIVSMPGDGIVTLDSKASESSVDDLVRQLERAGATVQRLSEIGVLTYQAKISASAQILSILKAHKAVAAVEADFESYRAPYVFDTALLIAKRGVIDADSYRQSTKRLKDDGLPFVTETTIPTRFQ